LLDSRPRFVEDFCEELRLGDGVRAIGDYRTNAAFTRRLPTCLRIIALVRDNGAGINRFCLAVIDGFADCLPGLSFDEALSQFDRSCDDFERGHL